MRTLKEGNNQLKTELNTMSNILDGKATKIIAMQGQTGALCNEKTQVEGNLKKLPQQREEALNTLLQQQKSSGIRDSETKRFKGIGEIMGAGSPVGEDSYQEMDEVNQFVDEDAGLLQSSVEEEPTTKSDIEMAMAPTKPRRVVEDFQDKAALHPMLLGRMNSQVQTPYHQIDPIASQESIMEMQPTPTRQRLPQGRRRESKRSASFAVFDPDVHSPAKKSKQDSQRSTETIGNSKSPVKMLSTQRKTGHAHRSVRTKKGEFSAKAADLKLTMRRSKNGGAFLPREVSYPLTGPLICIYAEFDRELHAEMTYSFAGLRMTSRGTLLFSLYEYKRCTAFVL